MGGGDVKSVSARDPWKWTRGCIMSATHKKVSVQIRLTHPHSPLHSFVPLHCPSYIAAIFWVFFTPAKRAGVSMSSFLSAQFSLRIQRYSNIKRYSSAWSPEYRDDELQDLRATYGHWKPFRTCENAEHAHVGHQMVYRLLGKCDA